MHEKEAFLIVKNNAVIYRRIVFTWILKKNVLSFHVARKALIVISCQRKLFQTYLKGDDRVQCI